MSVVNYVNAGASRLVLKNVVCKVAASISIRHAHNFDVAPIVPEMRIHFFTTEVTDNIMALYLLSITAAK
jgi:hypothetical protein